MGQRGQGQGGLGADGGRRVVTCLLTRHSGHSLNSLIHATVVPLFPQFVNALREPIFLPFSFPCSFLFLPFPCPASELDITS